MTDTAVDKASGGERRFGPFNLIRVLGEGAMGRVWLAREDHPPREVALKLLRHPLLHGGFQHRFQREVRLLGSLEHPNIARLYRAGEVTDDNGALPYLAMEYVRGAGLLAHADTAGLDLAGRLRLVARIARAVHHAHTRGVIHRDLKPANILVDAQGEPRILDFGVAQLASGEEATQVTVAGEILGTVPYMAPEQFSGDPGAVDPRCDVYALGVIAFELLSGQLPHPGLRGASLITAVETLQRGEMQRLGRLRPDTRGDVETLVHTALARDPAQRYGSAAELAADIERWLQHQPITARPPSAAYLARLFVRRHRAVTAAAALVAMALVVATAVSARFALSESAARAIAESRLAEREAVTGFLQDMLTAADPERALGERLSVLDVLDVARAQLDRPGALPPGAAAQLYRTLGNTSSSLGRGAEAVDQLARARAALPATAEREAQVQLALDEAAALAAAGREAEALEQTQGLLRQAEAASLPPALRQSIRLQIATLMDQRGHLDAAEAVLRELLPAETDRASLIEATAQSKLALNLHRQGRHEESLALGRAAAAALSARLGSRHPRSIEAEEVIGLSLRDLARYDEAAALYRRTLALRAEVLGERHPLTQQTRASLAAVLAYGDQIDEAWPLMHEAYHALAETLGLEAETVRILGNLYAHVASQKGHYDEAVRVLRIIVAQNDAMPGGPSDTDLADYNNLAFNLMAQGRCDEALPVQAQLIGLAEQRLGVEHLHTALFRVNYANCLAQGGQTGSAREQLVRAVPVLDSGLGPEHPRSRGARERLMALGGG